METKHPESLIFTKQEIQNILALSGVHKPKFSKNKIKEPRITYEVVGTEAENQEKLDRVFDRIFDEVLRRREQKQGY